MSDIDVLDEATDLICGLKAAAKFLECHHEAFLKQQQSLEPQDVYKKPKRCPDEKNVKALPRNKLKKCKSQTSLKNKPNSSVENECVPTYKIPEMKMSYLNYKCFCLHRNGLQDECPLSACQGRPDCLVKPWAVCPPGRFFRALNPELYPAPPSKKLDCK